LSKMLKNELYKAFINKRFLIVLLIETFLILWYTIGEAIPVMNDHVKFVNDYIYAGRNMEKMTNRLPLGAYYLWIGFNYCKQRVVLYAVLPILAAIPYGTSLYTEKRSHYAYHLLMNSSKRKYYTSKLLTLFVSGGVVGAFPFLLSFLINAALIPLEQVSTVTSQFFSSNTIFSDLFYKAPILYIVVFLILTFICFGILNCFCFVGAYLLDNKFVVAIFPFVIYFVARVIEESIFSPGREITPWFSFKIADVYKVDIVKIIPMMIIILLIIVGVYLFKCRKKGDEL